MSVRNCENTFIKWGKICNKKITGVNNEGFWEP